MIEIKSSDRYFILNNYKAFTVNEFNFWHSALTKRIIYLNPLIECLEKSEVELFTISKDLYQEVFEVKELIKFLELFTSNKL
jgi:uncharacterized FlgJ-related protein